MIIEEIWILEEADAKRRRQIAKEKVYENIKYVRGIVEQHMKLDIGSTWAALDELRQERNLIAHGVWMKRFGGEPCSMKDVSARRPSPCFQSITERALQSDNLGRRGRKIIHPKVEGPAPPQPDARTAVWRLRDWSRCTDASCDRECRDAKCVGLARENFSVALATNLLVVREEFPSP